MSGPSRRSPPWLRCELQADMVIYKIETTTRHGAIPGKTQTTETKFYNLDAILSVGYRVKSKRGTQFRIWANQVLKQYLLQGYAINERIAAQKKRTPWSKSSSISSTKTTNPIPSATPPTPHPSHQIHQSHPFLASGRKCSYGLRGRFFLCIFGRTNQGLLTNMS